MNKNKLIIERINKFIEKHKKKVSWRNAMFLGYIPYLSIIPSEEDLIIGLKNE